MMDDPFTPDEQELIERLRAAPRPRLRPAARDAIRQQIIQELHAPTGPVQRPFDNLLHLTPQMAAALVAVAAIGLLALALVQFANHPAATGETATALPAPTNQVAVVPTQTSDLSVGSATPAVSESPSPSSTPEWTLSTTPTTEAPATPMSPITATLPATLETVVVVEGPITSIVNNIITIYDYRIEVEPQHPILAVIDIGDTVRAEGTLDSAGQVLTSVVGNIPSTEIADGDMEATVRLDGPVEAIDSNLVTVNGIPVQIAPDDPILDTLQVGDFVSVQGNFEESGQTIVLVVVNVTVIDNVTTAESACWYHDDGMGMGHWHCDGMGMGMGMGDAMGMGDDSMGMGE
jgi:hypothetical protein